MKTFRNRAIDQICSALKRLKNDEFEITIRRTWGTPAENTRELLELVTANFDAVRNRNDDTNLFIGRFLGVALLVEAKLEAVLAKVIDDAESLMLGRKIDGFRRLLRTLSAPEYGFDAQEITDLRELIGPLWELADIRNRMAHDLRYTRFTLDEIPQSLALVERERPDLARAVGLAPENDKPLVAMYNLGFVFSARIADLQQVLE